MANIFTGKDKDKAVPEEKSRTTKKITKTIEIEIEFPRNLYKSPGSLQWGSKKQDKSYDTVLVENDSEYEEALEAGYLDSFNDALFPKKESKKKEDDDEF
jgi:hypothetical protein